MSPGICGKRVSSVRSRGTPRTLWCRHGPVCDPHRPSSPCLSPHLRRPGAMIRCAGESVHGRNLAAFAPRDTMEEAGSKETNHGRERYMRTKLSLTTIFAAIAAVVMLEAAPAAAESTWDQIKRTGKLRLVLKETVVNEQANKDGKPFLVDDARQRLIDE